MSGSTRRWMLLRLEAPLLSFGGVAIDQRGPTEDFPGAALLTGLLANALGWRRTDTAAHQRLQDRLVFAARRDREPTLALLTDTQNAKLEKSDQGWTTRGAPEGRKGASYDAPHRRQRDYQADALLLVALTLGSADESPTIEDVATALKHPARPLFFGRKPCLPSAPITPPVARSPFVAAATAHAALGAAPWLMEGDPADGLRASWPRGEGPEVGPDVDRLRAVVDRRNWRSGLHGGVREIVEGRVSPALAAS